LKSSRGVTLTSLVIYIIGLVIVVGVMGTFTGYFYKNLSEVTIEQNSQEQYSKFLSYLTKDVNTKDCTSIQSGVNGEDCLIFKLSEEKEHQYIYKNETIYYLESNNSMEKKIVLCSNVTVSTTNIFNYFNGKIDANFNINGENFSVSLIKEEFK